MLAYTYEDRQRKNKKGKSNEKDKDNYRHVGSNRSSCFTVTNANGGVTVDRKIHSLQYLAPAEANRHGWLCDCARINDVLIEEYGEGICPHTKKISQERHRGNMYIWYVGYNSSWAGGLRYWVCEEMHNALTATLKNKGFPEIDKENDVARIDLEKELSRTSDNHYSMDSMIRNEIEKLQGEEVILF